MMGGHDSRGLIPRLCDTLFDRVADSTDPGLSHKVEVSYMEIYNEKVRGMSLYPSALAKDTAGSISIIYVVLFLIRFDGVVLL